MRKLARFGSLLLGLSACSTHLEYSGSVVDESGQPIRSALVTLEKDGTVVATDTAGKDGQFNVGTTEPAGFGCGILSDGYKLTVRRDGDASAAFAELHGRQFANLGSVKLLDQSLAVELQEGTVLMTTTSTAVLIDDGLTWDVPGAGAMPIEALGRSGKHTFRRTETQPVGTGGELKVASKGVDLTLAALPEKIAVSTNNNTALSDGSFAQAQTYDQSKESIELARPSAVRLFLLAGLTTEYGDLSKAIPHVTITQAGVSSDLSAVACQLHATTLQCWGSYENVERIEVKLKAADGTDQYFRSGEALVY